MRVWPASLHTHSEACKMHLIPHLHLLLGEGDIVILTLLQHFPELLCQCSIVLGTSKDIIYLLLDPSNCVLQDSVSQQVEPVSGADKTHWSHTVSEPPLGKDEVEVFSGLLGQLHLMVSTGEVHFEESLASRFHTIPDVIPCGECYSTALDRVI